MAAGARPATGDSCSSTGEGFALTGPSLPLDPRIHAYRSDIADIALAGQIIAPHYARPIRRACGSRAAFVRPRPDENAVAVTELLPGEEFAVLEYAGGWAWGYGRADHVVGYVEAIELVDPEPATHIVCEKTAPVSADERITAPVLAHLPMGSRLHGEEQGACLATEYGCVPLSHLRRMGDCDEDPVSVAERLLGAPWLVGGKTIHGIDDTGLVQLALAICGRPIPRFADQLERLGEALSADRKPARSDLILFEDGAALMVDDLMLIHASRTEGRVLVEPLQVVAARSAIRARRRLDG